MVGNHESGVEGKREVRSQSHWSHESVANPGGGGGGKGVGVLNWGKCKKWKKAQGGLCSRLRFQRTCLDKTTNLSSLWEKPEQMICTWSFIVKGHCVNDARMVWELRVRTCPTADWMWLVSRQPWWPPKATGFFHQLPSHPHGACCWVMATSPVSALRRSVLCSGFYYLVSDVCLETLSLWLINKKREGKNGRNTR